MDFFDTIDRRRSIRKFFAKPIPAEVIEKALDAALKAPNSSNMQAWDFYWVQSDDKKKELVKFCFKQGAALTAAELIVAVSRRDTWRRNLKLMVAALSKNKTVNEGVIKNYYGKVVPAAYIQGPLSIIGFAKWLVINTIGFLKVVPRGPCSRAELFNVLTKSTALACENFMLAMTAQGFGTCPMEGFDEVRVKKLLGLNRHCRVTMIIACGDPDEEGIYGKRLRFDKELFIHKV